MIRLKLMLCAHGVIRDAEDNTISIFSIIEGIQGVGFPLFLQKMDVLAIFERLPAGPPQIEVTFRTSIGDMQIFEKSMNVDFQDRFRNRTVLHVQGIVIPNPGTLRVDAIWEGNVIGTYEMGAEQIEPIVETSQN